MPPARSRESTARPTLLVVGPDAVAEPLADALDAHVDRVSSGAAALDRLATEPPDCLVTVYDLPDTTGDDLLDRVARRDGGLPAVLVARPNAAAEATDPAVGAEAVFDPADPPAVRAVANRVRRRLREPTSERPAQSRLRRLHDTASSLSDCECRADVYERTVEAAEQVLDLDYCLVNEVEHGRLVPATVSADLDEAHYDPLSIDEGGLAGAAYRSGDSSVVHDVTACPAAGGDSHEYRSILTVPFAGDALFQAGAQPTGAFDRRDLELTELLLSHAAESIERIDTERDLRERERFLSTLIGNLPGLAYRCVNEPEWPMEFVSEGCTELTGYDPEQITDGDVAWGADVMLDDDRATLWETVQAAVESREQFAVTYRIRTADGAIRWVWEQGRPVEREGEVRLEGFITDVTDRKRRERELREQTERLDAFARVLSHDLRNPLTVATGHLDAARRGTGDLDEHLDGLASAHERMTEIVDGVLALVRGEEEVADDTPVALAEVVDDAWVAVDTAALNLETADDLGVLYADGPLLGQILENLFRNAREHAGPEATVRVGSLAGDGFYVADDGPNLPESIRDSAFDLGERAGGSGTGTGLAIVRRIAAAHDWSVSVTESDAGGARFEFRAAPGAAEN